MNNVQKRVYLPEENKLIGNGSKYDLDIDNCIIQMLYKQQDTNYKKLKENTEKSVGRKLSPSTYTAHIWRLESGGILRRIDQGKGKSVIYTLTELARRQVRLHILGSPLEKVFSFRRIYKKILFNDVLTPAINIENEDDFEKIVSEFGIRSTNLRWGMICTIENDDGIELIYGKGNSTDKKLLAKKYWQARPGLSKELVEIEFTCFPLAYEQNFDMLIKRIEYWQINKKSESTKYRQEYLFQLPGFSKKDLHIDDSEFEKDKIDLAIKAMQDLKLIGPIANIQGEIRFVITDDRLHELLSGLWNLHEMEFFYLTQKWKYFDTPTSEEVSRMERLLGKNEAQQMFKQFESTRHQHNLFVRKCTNVEEYNEYRKRNDRVEWQANGISVSLDKLEDLEELRADADLDLYKEKRIKIPTNSREAKEDIHQFVNHLKEKIYNNIKYLSDDVEHVSLEELKMEYGDTLEEYSFLYCIINDICPSVFEPANHELQSKIINDNYEVGIATKELAKRLNGLYYDGKWHGLGNIKPKIPVRSGKFYNPQTHKVERFKAPDFTNI